MVQRKADFPLPDAHLLRRFWAPKTHLATHHKDEFNITTVNGSLITETCRRKLKIYFVAGAVKRSFTQHFAVSDQDAAAIFDAK
jgi:hypothetical protein